MASDTPRSGQFIVAQALTDDARKTAWNLREFRLSQGFSLSGFQVPFLVCVSGRASVDRILWFRALGLQPAM